MQNWLPAPAAEPNNGWRWNQTNLRQDKNHDLSGFQENKLWARLHQGISLSQTVTIFYSSQKPDKSKLEWFYFQGKQGTCLFFNTH